MGYVYLASPFRTSDLALQETNVELVTEAAAKLIDAGIMAFSPVAYSHKILSSGSVERDAELDWQSFGLTQLNHADALVVYCLEGHDQSTGIEMERATAALINLPVFEWHPGQPVPQALVDWHQQQLAAKTQALVAQLEKKAAVATRLGLDSVTITTPEPVTLDLSNGGNTLTFDTTSAGATPTPVQMVEVESGEVVINDAYTSKGIAFATLAAPPPPVLVVTCRSLLYRGGFSGGYEDKGTTVFLVKLPYPRSLAQYDLIEERINEAWKGYFKYQILSVSQIENPGEDFGNFARRTEIGTWQLPTTLA